MAISSLAEFTSKSIEQFHKTGELILLKRPELSAFVGYSEVLQRLTQVMSAEVGILSSSFTQALNKQVGHVLLYTSKTFRYIFLFKCARGFMFCWFCQNHNRQYQGLRVHSVLYM